jgi:hypothetical protein
MTVQCFFSAFSSSSMVFWPSEYFLAYFVKLFFLALFLHISAQGIRLHCITAKQDSLSFVYTYSWRMLRRATLE